METIRKVRLGTSSLVKDTTQDLRLSQWEKAVQDQQRESQDSPMDRLRTCSFTEPPPHPHALPYYSLATFPPKIPRPRLQWHIEFSFLDKVTFSFNKTFPKLLVSFEMLTLKVQHCCQEWGEGANKRKTLDYA